MKKLELIGFRFHNCEVIQQEKTPVGTHTRWVCKCHCGKLFSLRGTQIKAGTTKSCGCFVAENGRKQLHRHGHYYKPEYSTWKRMRERCLNPECRDYPEYGGRGIKICERWMNDFEAFYQDMGQMPSSRHSIDRIDFNGNYAPENCRWATPKEQSNNTRRNLFYDYCGRKMTLSEVCDLEKLDYKRIYHLVRTKGLKVEDAVARLKSS